MPDYDKMELIKTLKIGIGCKISQKSVVQNGDFIYFFIIENGNLHLNRLDLKTMNQAQL